MIQHNQMTRQLLPLYSILVSGFLRLSHKTYADFCDRNCIYNDFVHYDRLTTWENVILHLKQICDRCVVPEAQKTGLSDSRYQLQCSLKTVYESQSENYPGSYSALRRELLADLPSIAPFFEREQLSLDSRPGQSSGVPAEEIGRASCRERVFRAV